MAKGCAENHCDYFFLMHNQSHFTLVVLRTPFKKGQVKIHTYQRVCLRGPAEYRNNIPSHSV